MRILLRADSGFAREALMSWCERNQVDYVFGLARNARLEAEIAAELAPGRGHEPRDRRAGAALQGVLLDDAGQLEPPAARRRQGRMDARRAQSRASSSPRSSRARVDGRRLYEHVYCARGEMENRIKECQLDLFADRTSAATMRANQLRLWFASMAYVLLCALRRIGLAHTQFAQATCGTIRLRLFKIGALVRISCRRIKLAMASAFPCRRSTPSPISASPTPPSDRPRISVAAGPDAGHGPARPERSCTRTLNVRRPSHPTRPHHQQPRHPPREKCRLAQAQERVVLHPQSHDPADVELFISRPEGSGPWPVVLFAHGHQSPPRPGGRVFIRVERRPVLATIDEGRLERMSERGYFAAAVSLPGYGTTSGPPDFWGPRSQAAMRAALDHLLALPDIDREKVVVYGVSGGAATASMVATTEPRIKALILVAGVYDLAIEYPSGDPGLDAYIEREAGTTQEAFAARAALRYAERIGSHTLILHGERDVRGRQVEQARFLADRLRANEVTWKFE